MSFNRDNVIWQSGDGTWGRGFYTVLWTGDDPEWDVEYDYGSFEWASVGHDSEDAAHDSWRGANPGGCTCYPYDGNEEYCDEFDEMAREFESRNPNHNNGRGTSFGNATWVRRYI